MRSVILICDDDPELRAAMRRTDGLHLVQHVSLVYPDIARFPVADTRDLEPR